MPSARACSAQVGVLAAGDLVVVDVRGAGAEVALEGAVGAAHLAPSRWRIVITASGSIPGSRAEWRNAAAMDPRLGCEVRPLIESIAASTASTPASTAASTLAADAPLVSWVWKWMGMAISCLSAVTRVRAAAGLQRPAMSLMPRMCAPAASSSRASET